MIKLAPLLHYFKTRFDVNLIHYWRNSLIILILFLASGALYGQAVNSIASGAWNSASTWDCACVPDFTKGLITITAGNTVNVPNGFTADADQIIVAGGGALVINSGGKLSVRNSGGADLTIVQADFITTFTDGLLTVQSGGILENKSPGISSASADLIFQGGSEYQHNLTGGLIPPATWQSLSTCRVLGVTSTVPTGLSQNFHHFIWDCSAQSTTLFLAGSLTTINGDLTIQNTNNNFLSLGFSTNLTGSTTVLGNVTVNNTSKLYVSAVGTYTLNITGDLSLASSPTGSNTFPLLGTATGTVTTSVGGNVNFSTARISRFVASTGSFTLNATGAAKTLSVSGATIDMTSSSGSSTINLSGNFNLSTGSLARSGSGNGNINFAGTASTVYTHTGTASTGTDVINFSIATLRMVDFGTSALTGAGSFTLLGNATMKTGSADGIVPGITLGTIRVTGTRTYTNNANIIYNGSVAQFLGDEWGTGPLNGAAVNLEIANSAPGGVTNNVAAGTTNVVGILTLTQGTFFIGASNTLNVQSNFVVTAGKLGGSSSSNLTFSGSGSIGTLSFALTTEFLNNLTITRVTDVVMGSNLTIAGILALTNGNLDFSGFTLNMNGSQITSGGSGLKSNSTSNLLFGGSTFSGSIPYSGAGNQLNNLTFATPGGIFSWGNGVTVNTALTLTAGTLTHTSGITMASNSTFFKGAGSISGSNLLAASSYNVTYTGAGSTGIELPTTSTALNNLTVNSGGTVSLATSNITVNGNALFSGGSFSAGSNNLIMKGSSWNISGGSFSAGTGTVTFSGITSFAGTSPIFNNVTVTGTLTPGINYQINGLLNVTVGTLNNGTVTTTFGGTSSVTGTPTFFNAVIASGGSFSPPSTFTVGGTLINDGTMATTTTINLTGAFTNSAIGVFTAPTNFNLSGSFTNSGTFNHNSGTVTFNGTASITGTPTFNNITVGGSGVLTPPSSLTAAGTFTNGGTFNAGTTFNLAGNFTDNGTFNRGTGTVVFNGTSQQSISGSATTDFNNISVTNSTGGPPAILIQSNQNLRGVLTLATNSSFDADGISNTSIFKLISTGDSPTVDAGIATLPSGASVSGSVTVQRYMAIEGGNSTRIYRYISSPVSGAAVSQIQVFIPVTGPFTGVSSCPGCDPVTQSMFAYDETVITGDLNTGYINFPSAANTETFALGRGYAIYERGNVTPVSTAGNGRWELRGPINSGNVSLPVSYTNSGIAADDGWNLIGNPYPATIDWDAVSWTKTNINNALYMRDNGQISPVYATYIGGVGANGGSRYIATGQGFFIKANAASPVLQATEAVKVASQQTTFFREATEQKLIRIAMRQGIKSDEAVIRFTNESTNGFDSQWDAIKLTNPTSTSNPMFSFSSVGSDNAKYVINSLQQLSCGTAVKMDVSNAASGSYSLNFTQLEYFPSSVSLLLKDAYTNTSVDMRNTASYNFTVDTSVPGTFGGGRFTIQFDVENDLPTSINAISKDFCSGQEGKLTIKGSKLGTSYSLFQEGKQIQDPLIGTGNDIQFALSKTIKAGINTIEVKASSQSCNTLSISQNILVNNVSLPVISSVTNSKNCNAGALTLIAAGAPANGSYRWYGSKDSLEPIQGQTSEKFITPVLNKTKTYYVSTMNSLGCEGDRKEVLAEIINYDNALITLVDSLTLSSNYDTGNQWYFEDKPIDGATGKTLKPEKTGIYKLKISTLGDCSTSAERTYTVNEVKKKETPATITGLEESLPSHMTVYPNPTSSVLSIAVKSSNEVNAKLLTVLGTSLYNQPLEGTTVKKGSFDMQEQADGIYILIVQDGDKIYKTRIIKKR